MQYVFSLFQVTVDNCTPSVWTSRPDHLMQEHHIMQSTSRHLVTLSLAWFDVTFHKNILSIRTENRVKPFSLGSVDFLCLNIANICSQNNHGHIALVIVFMATHFITGQINYTHRGHLQRSMKVARINLRGGTDEQNLRPSGQH